MPFSTSRSRQQLTKFFLSGLKLRSASRLGKTPVLSTNSKSLGPETARWSKMKILTLNFLTCARKTCKTSPAAFPLHPQDAELEIVEMEFNPLFIKNILPRVEWEALKGLCTEVCCPSCCSSYEQMLTYSAWTARNPFRST